MRVRTSKSRSVWFSCELISASCSLTQSAEVSHWAVHYVPAHSWVQLSARFCRLLLVTGLTSDSLDCTSTSSCEHMSICRYISHCLCFVVVNTTAFIWESTFSCQLISADIRLTQSAEMTAWAVDQVPASTVYAHFCKLLLVTVHTNMSLDCTSTSSCELSRSQHYIIQWRRQCLVWFSCHLISRDICLTQSAEMTPWAVDQVPASRVYAHFCKLLLVTVQTNMSLDCTSTSSCELSRSQHYIIQWRRQRLVWFSCQLISADIRLTQSADMTPWAVDQAPASRVYAHFCRLLLVIVRKNMSLDCTSTSSCELSRSQHYIIQWRRQCLV